MKKSKLYVISLTAVVAVFAHTQRVPAQYVRPTTGGTMREFNFNNPMSALAATMVMNKAREDALAKQLGVSNAGNRSSTATPEQTQTTVSKPADESSLRFRPAGSYIKTRELANQLSDDPAQRDQYFKLMDAVLDGFGQKVAAAGLQNDVAIALAYFFGENIRIYRGLPELSDQQFVNLRNNFASAIAAGGGLGNATDRQKQEMYETLVAYTGLTQFIYEQGRQANNEAFTKGAQQLAGQNLQTVTKASPDSLNLTGDGLTVTTAGDSKAGSSPVSSGNATSSSGTTIEIRQLAYEFKENEIRANQLYKGKRITVTGAFGAIGKYGGQTVLVFTRGLLNPDTICYFKNVNELAQLRTNQAITVNVTVLGFDGEKITLLLDNCALR